MPVEVRIDGGVATLTLNRPEKRNALDGASIEALGSALDGAGASSEVRVVLLRGAGRDFCAGLDLSELRRAAATGEEENLADARRLSDLLRRIHLHPRPVVAVVQGRALAAGCGLATACDAVLAHESAQFGYPEVRLGFVPAIVMALLVRRVGTGAAFDLTVRGSPIEASEAARLGLVTRVLPDAAFEDGVAAYASEVASRPTGAVATIRGLLRDLDGMGLAEGMDLGARVNAAARASGEFREGVRNFLERGGR